MRASELLGAPVIDASGREIGVVQDLRALREAESAAVSTRGRVRIAALIIGGDGLIDKMAHGWGFAEGRTEGPWILRRLTSRSVDAARVVPASLVESWGPERVRLNAQWPDLSSLKEVMNRE